MAINPNRLTMSRVYVVPYIYYTFIWIWIKISLPIYNIMIYNMDLVVAYNIWGEILPFIYINV